MYCGKEMIKIFTCYLIPKKSYGTLSKGAIFLANPVVRICALLIVIIKFINLFLFVIVNLVYSFIGKLAPGNLIKFLYFRIICIVFFFIISLSCVNLNCV